MLSQSAAGEAFSIRPGLITAAPTPSLPRERWTGERGSFVVGVRPHGRMQRA